MKNRQPMMGMRLMYMRRQRMCMVCRAGIPESVPA